MGMIKKIKFPEQIPGIHFLLKGFMLLKENPQLWKFCIWPVVITLVLLVPVLYYTPDLFSYLTNLLIPDVMTSGQLEEYFNSKANFFLRWLAVVFGGLLFILYIIIVWIVVSISVLFSITILFIGTLKVLAAPFNDILSQHVESITLGLPLKQLEVANFLPSLWIAVKTESQRAGIFMGIAIPLYFLSWIIPGIGPVVFGIILTIYACFWLTYDAMSYIMDRKLWTLKQRGRFLLRHPLSTFGFGFGLYVVLMTPVLNLFIMPLFVSGGTLLYIDLNKNYPEP
jgi:CysZ protein